MISRKEYILTRPWQERKYEYHRRKVQSAVPAIDNKPPLTRQHVNLKMKKQQKEKERNKRIEWENFLLLQRLNYVMRTNRVDNYWKTPQPGFLNRIGIYNDGFYKWEDDESEIFDAPTFSDHKRRSKCTACTPQKQKPVIIPEERIPWEPERKPVSKTRSRSVPAKKTSLPVIKEEKLKSSERPKTTSHTSMDKLSNEERMKIKREFNKKHGQSLLITRGCLKLSVKFPPDTTVKFLKGNCEKVVSGGLCSCKALSGFH